MSDPLASDGIIPCAHSTFDGTCIACWSALAFREAEAHRIANDRINQILAGAPDGELLSDDEKEAMDLTGKLANLLRKICVTPKKPLVHSASLDQWKSNQDNDWNECAVEIHVIQHRIMAQAAARAYPDKYRLMGAFFNHKSETLQSAEEAGKLFL